MSRRLGLLSVVAFPLGLYACDFGASELEIVAAEGAGSMQSDGGAASDSMGDSDATGGGSGDPDQESTYKCEYLSGAEKVLGTEEMGSLMWEGSDGPFVVPVSNNRLAVVVELSETVMDVTESTFVFRLLEDSSSGIAGSLTTYKSPWGLRNLSAATSRDDELVFVASNQDEIVQVSVPIIDNDSFGVPVETPIAVPAECQDGKLRDVHVAFGDVDSYAFSCSDEMDQRRTYFGDTVQGFTPLGEFTAEPSGGLNDYHRLGDVHFISSGGDFGEASYRFGSTAAELSTFRVLSLHADRLSNIWTTPVPDGSGIFLVGASLTGAEMEGDPAPIVPAQFSAGFVATEDFAGLADAVPPTQLVPQSEIESKLDIVLVEDIRAEGDFVYLAGHGFAPPDNTSISLHALDGTKLVSDFIVDEEPGSTMRDAKVETLGIGKLVVYVKDDELYARPVLCDD